MALCFLSIVLYIALEASCSFWHSVAMIFPIKYPYVWSHGKMRPGCASLQLNHVGLPYSNHVANDDSVRAVVGIPLAGAGIPLTGVGVALPDDIMFWQMPHSHMPTI